MEVRKATTEDAHWIARELKDFADFYISEISLYHSDEYTIDFITELIQDHVVLVAISDDGDLLGFVAGHVSRHPYRSQSLFSWV